MSGRYDLTKTGSYTELGDPYVGFIHTDPNHSLAMRGGYLMFRLDSSDEHH